MKLRPQAETLSGSPQPNFVAYQPAPIIAKRAPTTGDTGYAFGQIWDDKVGGAAYILISVVAGSANWQLAASGTGAVATLTGGSGGAISPSSGNINLLGTANQIATVGSGSTITFSLVGPYTPATYTAHGVLIGEGTSSIAATAAGATGQLFSGVSGADPVWTASPSISGNYVGTTAGNGFSFNANTATGVAASPIVLNSRAGAAVFTTVSIAAAADLTLTITNSAITGSSTQVIYAMYGATTGSALSIKSVTNTAGSSAVVVTNGTGATTTTADITLSFLVVN